MSVKDTVKGWGKIRLKNLAGQATGYMDVLAVKVRTTVTDSFFLMGAPMDPTLLAAVNLVQGSVSEEFEIRYYRAGEVTPLVAVQYADAAYTQENSAQAHMKRLPAGGVGVGDVIGTNGIRVYPNPVTNSTINVELNDAAQNWTYELTDMTGKKVASGNINASGTKGQIEMKGSNAAGIYHLNLLKNGASTGVHPLMIK